MTKPKEAKPDRHAEPATREEAKYGAIRVGRCEPYCVLPVAWNSGPCLMCGQPCAHGAAFEFTAWPIPLGPDWTCEAGRSNSSRAFRDLTKLVNQIIRESGPALIRGQSESVAQLIIAQLAHVERIGGPGTMLDPNERGAAVRFAKTLKSTPMYPEDRGDRDLVVAILERLVK